MKTSNSTPQPNTNFNIFVTKKYDSDAIRIMALMLSLSKAARAGNFDGQLN